VLCGMCCCHGGGLFCYRVYVFTIYPTHVLGLYQLVLGVYWEGIA
jgi:hypothetical protein